MYRFFLSISLAILVLVPSPGLAQQGRQADQSATSSSQTSTYRVNAGDELFIYVWGEERLQQKVKVLPDGTISFPLVGQIEVKGHLLKDIEAVITAKLRDQYRGQVPQVTVSVAATSGMQFLVMGKVGSPGLISPNRYVNVMQAVGMAGGPSEFANLNNVMIYRMVGGKYQIIHARLAALFKSGADARDVERANLVRIEAGDLIVVP